jgi:hypothetical protein
MNTPSTDQYQEQRSKGVFPSPSAIVAYDYARQWEAIARRLAEALRSELCDRYKESTECALADFDQLAKL